MDIVEKIRKKKAKICVVGAGYVGLPTAILFSESGFEVLCADINPEVVKKINKGEIHIHDPNIAGRLSPLIKKGLISATQNVKEAAEKSDVIIITVPTPVNSDKTPDLFPVESATIEIGKGLSKGKLVVLESTVAPLTTENIVLPILEEESGLHLGEFYLAFSPERYNPGDEKHWLKNICKVVGGVDEKSGEAAEALYSSAFDKIYKAPDARTAEAAKIIENTQRDLNIGLINELSLIFEKMNIDIYDVLEAAKTKWNFLYFTPGPGVGGHCLPVDPFYLVHAAIKHGHTPKIITAGRGVNNYMPEHTVDLVIKALNHIKKPVKGSKILVLGAAYKADIDDARESPAKPVIEKLIEMGADLSVHDPLVKMEALEKYGVNVLEKIKPDWDCVVLITDHAEYKKLDFRKLKTKTIVDTRNVWDKEKVRKERIYYAGVGRK